MTKVNYHYVNISKNCIVGKYEYVNGNFPYFLDKKIKKEALPKRATYIDRYTNCILKE